MHYKFSLFFFFLFTYFVSLSAQTNWQQTAVAAEKEARKQERLSNADLTIAQYTKAFDLYQANKDIGGVYAGYCLATALFKVNKVDEALAVADKIDALVKTSISIGSISFRKLSAMTHSPAANKPMQPKPNSMLS